MCVNACVLSTCLHTDVYSIHTIMTGPVRHVLTLGDEVTGCVCVVVHAFTVLPGKLAGY